jgi:predicted unusual protein kinase regulating ubiquinone biosynthesis (AarF/ABC1/UbiB family)
MFSIAAKFNELVYQYPIRIPERFSLVIRSLLTQEGICLNLQPDFKFLEVAYPYVAKRLLTDPNPALRERLIQARYHIPNHGCERMLETRMVIGVHFPSLSFEWDCV